MKPDQKFTPKYWVTHDPETDDVYIETLAKSRDQTRTKSIEMYNDPFTFYEHLEQGKIAIILVEINEVKL